MYQLNRYSWIIILSYLTAVVAMEGFSYSVSMESIYLTLPLLAAFIFWSESTTLVIQESDYSMTKNDRFKQDLFVISFSFFSGNFFSLLLQYNNGDARGWWAFAAYFISAFGVLFAFVFSLIAMMLNNHRTYTFIYSIIIILFFMFGSLMMHLNPFSFFARDEGFNTLFFLLMGMHFVCCVSHSVCEKYKKRKNAD